MSLSNEDFELFINAEEKLISSDIRWSVDEDHSPSVEFSVEIENVLQRSALLKGTFNPLAQRISFAIIMQGVGRIYALDLGQDHKNPEGDYTGRKHKHRWTLQHKDKWAYVPNDITVDTGDIAELWRQFCIEAKIQHGGQFHLPPPRQQELF